MPQWWRRALTFILTLTVALTIVHSGARRCCLRSHHLQCRLHALAVWALCCCMFWITRVVAVLWLDGAMPLLCCMFCGACALLGGVLCRCCAAYSGPLVWCVCSGWVCLCCAPCFQSARLSRVVRVLWLGGCYATVVHADPPLHSPPLHVGLFLHSHPHMWARPSAAPPCTQALSCTASPPHAGPLLYRPACMQSPVQPPPHAGPLLYSPACSPLSACTPSPYNPPPCMQVLSCTAPAPHAGPPLHSPPRACRLSPAQTPWRPQLGPSTRPQVVVA